jgi:hypothetical protein
MKGTGKRKPLKKRENLRKMLDDYKLKYNHQALAGLTMNENFVQEVFLEKMIEAQEAKVK